jgi:hypothetical protein
MLHVLTEERQGETPSPRLATSHSLSIRTTRPPWHRRDAVIEAAKGLTTDESESAFALSLAETGKLDPAVIAREKANGIAKGGLLEFHQPVEGLESVGGLGNLKKWLERRKASFSRKAREFGLPAPRGLLLVGLPGCGKSLSAKAVAKTWQLPLLKVDFGRLMGSLVGQSEEQLRRAIATAEACCGCEKYGSAWPVSTCSNSARGARRLPSRGYQVRTSPRLDSAPPRSPSTPPTPPTRTLSPPS